MRKYCRACGSSLIKTEEEPTIEPVEEPEEEPVVETPSFSEDEPLVSPSKIASEQVEMESDAPEVSEEIEEIPDLEEMSIEPEEEDIPKPEPMDDERGKEVVADILEKVRAAEARASVEEIPEPSETDLEPPPPEPLEAEEPLAYEEPVVEPEVEVEPIVEEEPVTGFVSHEAPSETAETPPPAEIGPDPEDDEKVRVLETDINAYNIELTQLQSDLDSLRDHLDAEVMRYSTVAEVKRTRVESIERELDLAKKEYSDASKEQKNVDNRRKKELQNAEKRIHEVEKRIKKAEESKEKRIEDLEKERRKREEEARKD
jgi:hypothetical protein